MQFVFYLAVLVTILFIVKLILTMIGIGSESDVDIDIDLEVDGSITTEQAVDGGSDASYVLFTLDSILAFLMVFLWTFLMCVNQLGFSLILSLMISLVCALIIVILYSFLISKVRKLETPEVVDMYPEVEQQGIMYLSTQTGKGKAKFSVDGKYVIYDVYAQTNELTTGMRVYVTKIEKDFITVQVLENNNK